MTPEEHLATARFFYDQAYVGKRNLGGIDSHGQGILLASIAQSLLAIATRMVNQEQEEHAMASKVPHPVS